MASDVDICNLALGHIGAEANVHDISPPDGSEESEQCAKFYPIARDVLLEYAWSFNTRRQALAELAENPVDSWALAYSLPSSCMKPLAVLLPGTTNDSKTQDYVVETLANGSRVLFTNVEEAVLKFAVRVTDTTKFTPGFVSTLSILLGSYLAGPLLKGRAGVNAARALRELFRAEVAMAHASDANASQQLSDNYKTYTPKWISDR